jgi:LacI family transcriptional regulator
MHAQCPPLSSIDFGFERVGYEAAALLDRLMDGAPPPDHPIWIVPASLEARQSSDAYVVDDPVVARALRFIVEHSHEPIDGERVADHVLVSRRTLARRFQRELGQTLYDVITRMRLERAKRAMMEPGAALKTVAKRSGFGTAANLSEVFRRLEGQRPNAYRTQRGWER